MSIDTFSLRDEIGTFPNIEIHIDVTDRTPFFIRPYHIREEGTIILDKEMKRLCVLRNTEKRFFSLFKPSDVN